MKIFSSFAACVAYLILGGFLLAASGQAARAGDLKIEAQLIWGTNDEKSPDPKHKPVESTVEKRLKKLPFKWQHYFQVTKKPFEVGEGDTQKVVLSKDCEIKVRNVGKETVEVLLFGKGECIGKILQSLPKEELLVLGGNAENFTAWFVVLRQTH